jgi:hypothetical protein
MFVLTYHNPDGYGDGASEPLAVSLQVEALFAVAAKHQADGGNDPATIRLSWRKRRDGATGVLRETGIGRLSDHYEISSILVV